MTTQTRFPRWSGRTRTGFAAAALLALGLAGGAGAVSLTRPAIQMAPAIPTGIAKLSGNTGIVTVKGRVAEVYGDRFVIEDRTGRTMVDAGRRGEATVTKGQTLLVQGRFDNGQLRASYLVGADGEIEAVGPAGFAGRHGPDGHGGPAGPDPRDRAGPPPAPGAPRPAVNDDAVRPGGSGCPTPQALPDRAPSPAVGTPAPRP